MSRFVVSAVAVLSLIAPDAARGESPTPIAWRSDLETAWKDTKASRKPMLLLFTIDGCFYCAKMKQYTFSDRDVSGEVSRSFVPALVDGDRYEKFASKLGINVYPTMLIISPSTKIVDRIEGYASPVQLQRRLVSNRKRSPNR